MTRRARSRIEVRSRSIRSFVTRRASADGTWLSCQERVVDSTLGAAGGRVVRCMGVEVCSETPPTSGAWSGPINSRLAGSPLGRGGKLANRKACSASTRVAKFTSMRTVRKAV